MQEANQNPGQTNPVNGQLETAELELVSGGLSGNKLNDQNSAIEDQKNEAAARADAAMNAASQEMLIGISAGVAASSSGSGGLGTKRKGK